MSGVCQATFECVHVSVTQTSCPRMSIHAECANACARMYVWLCDSRWVGGGEAGICVRVCVPMSLEVPGESLGRQTAGLSEHIPVCVPLPGREWAGVEATGRGTLSAHRPLAAAAGPGRLGAEPRAPSCPPPAALPPPPHLQSAVEIKADRGGGGAGRASVARLTAHVSSWLPSPRHPPRKQKPPAAHHEAALRAARAPLVTRPARAAPWAPRSAPALAARGRRPPHLSW